MTEDKSVQRKISDYLKSNGVDPDNQVRNAAAERLYAGFLKTGASDLKQAALGIWNETGAETTSEMADAEADFNAAVTPRRKLFGR